jgi:hypothetical protein
MQRFAKVFVIRITFQTKRIVHSSRVTSLPSEAPWFVESAQWEPAAVSRRQKGKVDELHA